MKNRKLHICIGLLVSAALLGIVWFFDPFSKATAFHYVKNHNDELNAYARQVIAERPVKELRYEKRWTVNYYPSAPGVPAGEIVEFEVDGFGFGSATSYNGFYYSPDDVPMGFQGALLDLTETSSGWSWQEENGDNHQTIEKICDHWYWYEAHF